MKRCVVATLLLIAPLAARAVSHAAGARGDDAERLREALIEDGEIKIDRARERLQRLAAERRS